MDRQLACATFAAVIPVLGLAGILAREYWLSMVESRFGLLMSYVVVVAFAFVDGAPRLVDSGA